MYKLLNWGFLQNGEYFPLNNDHILEDSGDVFYPMTQMFMQTIQTSSFVDMLTCSDEVQPSTALIYIASQQLWQTELNIHWTEIPLHSMLAFSSLENPHFVQQNTGTMAVDQAKFSPCIGRRNFRIEIDDSKTPASKNITQKTKSWMAAWVECCKAKNINALNFQ